VDDSKTWEWIGDKLAQIDQTSPIGSGASTSYLYPEYRDRPLDFIGDVLGKRTWKGKVALWEGQRAIVESVFKNKVTCAYSSRGTGKDHVASELMLAFFYTRFSRVLCLAPSMRQLQVILFSEVSKRFHGAKQKLEGELLSLKLKLPDDASHYILGIPAGDPDRVRGFHAGVDCPGDPDQDELTEVDVQMIQQIIDEGGKEADEVLIVVDEPEGISDEVFRVLEGTLSKPGARILFIGNPAQSLFEDHTYPNHLRNIESKAHTINLNSIPHSEFPGENEDQIAMFDEIYTVPGWLVGHEERQIAKRKNQSQDPIFLSDWRGLFSEDAMAAQVIPLTALIVSGERYMDRSSRHAIGPRVGVDLGFGGDPSVATLMVDGIVCSTYSWRSPRDDKAMQVNCARKISQLVQHWGREVAQEFPESWDGGAIVGQRLSIDQTGLPGVCDILHELDVETDRVDFGSSYRGDPMELVSANMKMVNQRAGMYWHARMGLQEGVYHVPREERFAHYWEQLPWTLYEREFDTIKLEPKKKVIERHGHSPDYADSFVLACVPTGDSKIIWSTGGPVLSNDLPMIGDKGMGERAITRPTRSRRQWKRFEVR
tara:strand:- start:26701 stop:28494 length:1794 start_codon:yes stop_codon:yes gene_type:complete